jgi:hypothetical protein
VELLEMVTETGFGVVVQLFVTCYKDIQLRMRRRMRIETENRSHWHLPEFVEKTIKASLRMS